jgi:hypothetical protein
MSGARALADDRPQPFENGSECGIDAKPALREWIAQNLHMVCHESETAWRCAEVADDSGLRYHVRRLVAHAKQVATSTNELRSVNDLAPARDGGAS